jgi:hypothetical protein
VFDKFQASLFTVLPLFNDSPENNKKIVSLINGEFICSKFNTTLTYKYAPDANVDTVCSFAVPPYYGQFRGWILVYLKNAPDSADLDEVKIIVRELSYKLDNPKS